MGQREPRFDLDPRRGQQGELFVSGIISGLQNGTTEVKTDDEASRTGNLYIETECLRSGAYQPSGLSTTEADTWAFVIHDVMLAVPTKRLRELLPKLPRGECKRGSHPTRGRLLPISGLIAVTRREAMSAREPVEAAS